MKFALISDLHLREWPYAATVDSQGCNSRLMYQKDVLLEFLNNIGSVDAIMICGDIFHTKGRYTAQELEVASEFFYWLSQLDRPVTVLVGNHDMETEAIHGLSFLEGYRNINIVEEPIDDYGMLFIPYMTDKERLSKLLTSSKSNYAFLHQGVRGTPLGNGFVVPNEILEPWMCKSFKHVFTGHYHSHSNTDNITVVGAPMQHTWGDIGQNRGWLIYDTATDLIVFYKSDHPEFLQLDYNSVSTPEVSDHINVINCFVRVKNYKGEPNELIRLLKDYGAISVEVEPYEETHTNQVEQLRSSAIDLDALMRETIDAQTGRRKEIGQSILENTYDRTIKA